MMIQQARNGGVPSQPPRNNPKGDPPTRPAQTRPVQPPPPRKSARAAVALLLAVLALAGCDPEQGGGPKHEKPPAPTAGAGAQKHEKSPAPTAGEGDKKHEAPPMTEPGEIDLHVEWISENDRPPACQWSLNKHGQHDLCPGVGKAIRESGHIDYIGIYEYTVPALGHPGDVIELFAHGNFGSKSIECSIGWKSQLFELPSDGKQCGGGLTLP